MLQGGTNVGRNNYPYHQCCHTDAEIWDSCTPQEATWTSVHGSTDIVYTFGHLSAHNCQCSQPVEARRQRHHAEAPRHRVVRNKDGSPPSLATIQRLGILPGKLTPEGIVKSLHQNTEGIGLFAARLLPLDSRWVFNGKITSLRSQ